MLASLLCSTRMAAVTLLATLAVSSINQASSSSLRALSPALCAGADTDAGSDAAVTIKRIMHFSDVHLNISESLNASEYTDIQFEYGLDAPINLLTSALEYAKKVLPDPDFFLYTGDHAVHADDVNVTDEYLAEAVETNVETMAKYYPDAENDTMLGVTALMGNADTTPDYTMNVTDPETEVNPAIALISEAWADSLSKSNLDAFNHYGYLPYALDENLMVLTLNTVPYSPSHLPDTSEMPDPFEQFDWLNASLLALQQEGKFAYVVGHIPPIIDSYAGAAMWNSTYIETYKQIVSQYTDVIKAQIFGHVHSIEVRVPLTHEQEAQMEETGAVLPPLFMAAVISPIFSNNPAFTIWDFDSESYDLLDFTVYGSNITDDTQVLDWHPLFTASEAYGVSSLNTSEMNEFMERAVSDPELVEQYYHNAKAQSTYFMEKSCLDSSCQAQWLCTFPWFTTEEEYAACVSDMEEAASSTSTESEVTFTSTTR